MNAFLQRAVFTACSLFFIQSHANYIVEFQKINYSHHPEYKAISCLIYWEHESNENKLIMGRSIIPYGRSENLPENSILKYLEVTESGIYHSYEEFVLNKNGHIISGKVDVDFLSGIHFEGNESSLHFAEVNCNRFVNKIKESDKKNIHSWALGVSGSEQHKNGHTMSIPQQTIPLALLNHKISSSLQPAHPNCTQFNAIYDPLFTVDAVNSPSLNSICNSWNLAWFSGAVVVMGVVFKGLSASPLARYKIGKALIGTLALAGYYKLGQEIYSIWNNTKATDKWKQGCLLVQSLNRNNVLYRSKMATYQLEHDDNKASSHPNFHIKRNFFQREEIDRAERYNKDYCSDTNEALLVRQSDQKALEKILSSYQRAVKQ